MNITVSTWPPLLVLYLSQQQSKVEEPSRRKLRERKRASGRPATSKDYSAPPWSRKSSTDERQNSRGHGGSGSNSSGGNSYGTNSSSPGRRGSRGTEEKWGNEGGGVHHGTGRRRRSDSRNSESRASDSINRVLSGLSQFEQSPLDMNNQNNLYTINANMGAYRPPPTDLDMDLLPPFDGTIERRATYEDTDKNDSRNRDLFRNGEQQAGRRERQDSTSSSRNQSDSLFNTTPTSRGSKTSPKGEGPRLSNHESRKAGISLLEYDSARLPKLKSPREETEVPNYLQDTSSSQQRKSKGAGSIFDL